MCDGSDSGDACVSIVLSEGSGETSPSPSTNKPLRNCDLYGGDYKMLHTAWFDWTASPSGMNPDGTVKLTFAEWLLAPATEKEGGVK